MTSDITNARKAEILALWIEKGGRRDPCPLNGLFNAEGSSFWAFIQALDDAAETSARQQIETVSEFFNDGIREVRTQIVGLRDLLNAAEKRHAARHEKLAARGPDSAGELP